MNARVLTAQALRYGIAGVLLAGLYSAVYWLLAVRLGCAPQLANLVAFVVNLAAGWLLHSRFSFRGHGYSRSAADARVRFFAINLAGYGLNAVWVWLVVHPLRLPASWAIMPIVTLTPAFNFVLNRWLVFRPQPSPDITRP